MFHPVRTGKHRKDLARYGARAFVPFAQSPVRSASWMASPDAMWTVVRVDAQPIKKALRPGGMMDSKQILELATARHLAGEFGLARELYESALALEPVNANLMFRLGVLDMQCGAYYAALGWLDVFVLGLGEENCNPSDVECLKRQKHE